VDHHTGLEGSKATWEVVSALTDTITRTRLATMGLTQSLPKPRGRTSSLDRDMLAWLAALVGDNVIDVPGIEPVRKALDAYFAGGLLALPAVAAPPGAGVVDHLPPLPLAVRGVPLADVLRPAYVALTGDDADAAEDESCPA